MSERIDTDGEMSWDRYAALCDRGDVVSRWLLDRTASLLDSADEHALAARLRRALNGPIVPRPRDHRGGAAAEFLMPGLSLKEVDGVARCVEQLARSGHRLADGRSLGGLPEAWGEYRAWLDGTHPRSPRRGQAAAPVRASAEASTRASARAADFVTEREKR